VKQQNCGADICHIGGSLYLTDFMSETNSTQIKPKRIWMLLGNGILLAYVLVILGLMVTYSDHGLGLTDEGLALSGARFPREILATITGYFDYNALLFAFVGYNVAYLRILGVALLAVSGFIFSLGLSQWLKTQSLLGSPPSFSMAFFCAIGSLFYCTYWSCTITYNILNAFAITSATGLIFLGLSLLLKKSEAGLKYGKVCLFFGGTLLGFDLFVKSPSAILATGLLGLLVSLSPLGAIRSKVQAVMMILVGFVSWCLLHFIFIKSPVTILQEAFICYRGMTSLGQMYTSPLTRYGNNIWELISQGSLDFWPVFLVVTMGFLLAEVLRKYRFDPRTFLVLLIIGSFGGIIYLSHAFGYAQGAALNSGLMEVYVTWLFLLLWIAALSVMHFRHELWPWSIWRPLLLGGFVCGAATFAAAAGTGNPIYLNTVLSLGPWFGLLVLLLLIIAQLHSRNVIYFLGVIAIGYLAFFQIVTGSLRPYNLKTDIFRQTIPTEVGSPVTRLKLDPETHHFYVELQKLCRDNGFRSGDDVLIFYDMPGIAYVLGGKAPGMPWLIGPRLPAAEGYNDVFLSMVPLERLKKAFIIEDQNCDANHPHLRQHGLDFPDNYILCGTLVYPLREQTISVWKPKN